MVPLHVLVGGRDFREGIDPVDAGIIGADGVTTSGASVADLADAYRTALGPTALGRADGVVSLHLSSRLSRTWESAREAAREFGGAVRVVDSGTTALGLGFAAAAAARLAALGAGMDDVYDHAVRVSATARCFVVVDKLDHLRSGGRITATQSLFGTALAAKPLLHIDEGALTTRAKVRTMGRALTALADAAADHARSAPGAVAVAVHHVLAPDRARVVESKLRDRIPLLDNVIVTDLGDVLGVHVGPGSVGVAVVHTDPG